MRPEHEVVLLDEEDARPLEAGVAHGGDDAAQDVVGVTAAREHTLDGLERRAVLDIRALERAHALPERRRHRHRLALVEIDVDHGLMRRDQEQVVGNPVGRELEVTLVRPMRETRA